VNSNNNNNNIDNNIDNNIQLWSLSKKLIPKIRVFDENSTEKRFTIHFKGHLQTVFCGKKVCCGEPVDQQQQQQHSPVGMTEYDEAVFELLRPESLVCRLFVTELTDLESVLIVGTETFCKVAMENGNFFSYEGDFVEPADATLDDKDDRSLLSSSSLLRGSNSNSNSNSSSSSSSSSDCDGNGRSCMVLMDGLTENIEGGNGDFSKAVIDRELKKAFSCFSRWETIEVSDDNKQLLFPMVTGLWHPNDSADYELRAMIQLLAAAEAGRDQITFYVGKEVVFKEALEEVVNGIIVADKMTVGDLYNIMTQELLLATESPSSKSQEQQLQQQPRRLFQLLKEKKRSLLMKSQ